MKTKALAITLILALTLSLTACGNTTTLNRVGAGFQQAAKGFQAEINALKAAGQLSDAKFMSLARRANGLITASDVLANYLNGLSGVNAANKAEVLGKIAEATSLVRGLLQNPDLLSLANDNLAIKILTFADITLQNAAVVLAAINAPAPETIVASDAPVGVPTSAIKVKVPDVPKGAEKYFSK